MKKVILVALVLIVFVLLIPNKVFAGNEHPFWQIQSVDTMKLSRDEARQMLDNIDSPKLIDNQIKLISDLGATHVAIGTPYDAEFNKVLKMWVNSARNHGLNVWFRGNMAGWENWFGYSSISKDAHLSAIRTFILDNPDVFEDGDIFTPCPECENGVIGDPRTNGDVIGFRNFLIAEYKSSADTFNIINKNVKTGYFSMNGDVARLIMDKETTRQLGSIVVVDHYVKTPEQLAQDIEELALISGGSIVLGEVGVPIPDIHGNMSEYEQKEWLSNAMALLVKSEYLIGINYWTASNGTTALWTEDDQKNAKTDVLGQYYTPRVLSATLVNEVDMPIRNALVTSDSRSALTDDKGNFTIPLSPTAQEVLIHADTYYDLKLNINELDSSKAIVLAKAEEGVVFKILKTLYMWGYRFD